MRTFLRYGCVVALMSLFFCCKKSTTNFYQVYTATSLTLQTDTRMFTNGHEVTDKAIINKYILGDSTFNVTFSPSPDNFISFSSADTASFGNPPLKYSVVKNGSLYLFYSKNYPVPQTFPAILKYTGGQISVPYGGNSAVTQSQEVRVATGDNFNLHLSVLVYKYRIGFYYAQGYDYNQYNEALTTGPHDTIAVKQYVLNFKGN